MTQFICPNCNGILDFATSDGKLSCQSCGYACGITEFEHPALGSARNSEYITELSAGNINTDYGAQAPKDGTTGAKDGAVQEDTAHFPARYIPFKITEDDIHSLFKGLKGLFIKSGFKSSIKENKFEKLYIPTWSNKVELTADLDAVGEKFSDNTTNYYTLEKQGSFKFERLLTPASSMYGASAITPLFPYDFNDIKETNLNPGEDFHDCDVNSDVYTDNINKYAKSAASRKMNSLTKDFSSIHDKKLSVECGITSSSLLYLPAYKISSGKYSDNDNIYVNGQTGSMTAKPPVSRLKIAVSFLLTGALLYFIILLLTMIPTRHVSAQDLSYDMPLQLNPVVEDKADLFTDYEEVTISNRFSNLRDQSGFQYIFMTVTDTTGYVRGSEVETMYGQYRTQLYGTGTVLFLISTDPENLICEIQAYSDAKTVLTHEVCGYISRQLCESVSEGKYSECIDRFFDYYDRAYAGTLSIDETTDSSSVNAFIILIAAVSMLLSAVIHAVIIFRISSTGAKSNIPDSCIIGNCSYKFRLTRNKVTYIRSRRSSLS